MSQHSIRRGLARFAVAAAVGSVGAMTVGGTRGAFGAEQTSGGLTAPSGPRTETLKALSSAYSVLTRGAEFAASAGAKADAEKQASLGSLFRAIARAQQIQAGLIKGQIVSLGGTANVDATSKAIDVGDTKANLASALKLLTALKDTDLPAWRRACDGEGNREAVKVLRWTREGTIELGRFVKDNTEAADAGKAGKKDYFVSRTCGFTVEKLDFQKCPVCAQGRDDFEKVN